MRINTNTTNLYETQKCVTCGTLHHKSWLFDIYGKQQQEQSSFICLSCRVKMDKKVTK